MPKSSSEKKAGKANHMALWKAIQHTRAELERWQQQSEMIDSLFRQHILPREQRLTAAVQGLTKELIGHFSNTSLTGSEKSLIGLWVNDNLTSLQDHPFALASQTTTLNECWMQAINHPGKIETQLSMLARKTGAESSITPSPTHADIGVSAASKSTPSESNQRDGKAHVNCNAEQSQSKVHHHEPRKEPSNKKDKVHLNKKPTSESANPINEMLCVERLFRQLAKVLHPDREQDDSAKANKHELMSQCLTARNEKDIDTLLRLYCEHVGEIPEDIKHEGYAELVLQLRAQLHQLQVELHQLRFGDPMHSMIVERYAAGAQTDSEHRIKEHAISLDHEIKIVEKLCSQLDTIEGLQEALTERRMIEQDRLAINELTGNSMS